METASSTNVGCVRSVNQDRLYSNVEYVNSIACGLFVVADGMGGLDDGHLAASTAVRTIDTWWHKCLFPMLKGQMLEKYQVRNELDTILRAINKHVLSHNQYIGIKSGTTLSLLLICDGQYFIAHCGDSRIYVVQKTWLYKKQFKQLTEDHSWGGEQLRRNILTVEEISVHPHKNTLTSCLGIFEHPRIFISCGKVQPLDVFILCSDGLYNMINDKQLSKFVATQKDCKSLVDKCIQAALAQGANDNVSVIAVKCKAR